MWIDDISGQSIEMYTTENEITCNKKKKKTLHVYQISFECYFKLIDNFFKWSN